MRITQTSLQMPRVAQDDSRGITITRVGFDRVLVDEGDGIIMEGCRSDIQPLKVDFPTRPVYTDTATWAAMLINWPDPTVTR